MLLSGMFASTAARADSFSELVVFGDSLSDNGNAGRFTNGSVWVEDLAEHFGLALRPSRAGGTNHAVGGARAAGGPNELRAQVRAYLAGRRGKAQPRTLYVVWAGGNDLLAAGLAADPDAVGPGAAAAMGEAVNALAAAGARTLLVPNLPDVGMTPALQAFGSAAAAAARRWTYAYDDALALELDRVAAQHRVAILRLDVRTLAERMLADPGAAGFSNLTEPCQGRPSCKGALFWDLVHPTAQAHARLAAAALEAIEAAAPG
ncbi:MAG: SGNH/GDSL hydrolase family protein [Geminicoccaceae bacterium]